MHFNFKNDLLRLKHLSAEQKALEAEIKKIIKPDIKAYNRTLFDLQQSIIKSDVNDDRPEDECILYGNGNGDFCIDSLDYDDGDYFVANLTCGMRGNEYFWHIKIPFNTDDEPKFIEEYRKSFKEYYQSQKGLLNKERRKHYEELKKEFENDHDVILPM